MDLEDSVLTEISQAQRPVLHDLIYMWNPHQWNADSQSRLVAARGRGRETGTNSQLADK